MSLGFHYPHERSEITSGGRVTAPNFTHGPASAKLFDLYLARRCDALNVSSAPFELA